MELRNPAQLDWTNYTKDRGVLLLRPSQCTVCGNCMYVRLEPPDYFSVMLGFALGIPDIQWFCLFPSNPQANKWCPLGCWCKTIWVIWTARRFNLHWKNPLSKQVTRQWEKYGMHLYVTILWGRIFAESFQLFKILSKVEDVFCRSWAKDVMKRCYLCTFSWTPAVISKTKVIFHKYIHYRNT